MNFELNGIQANVSVEPAQKAHDPKKCPRCRADQTFLKNKKRPPYERQRPTLRTVDLFAGCGGMTLGAAESARLAGLGLDIRLAVDSDPQAHEVYGLNFPGGRIHCDYVETFFDGVIGEPKTAAERNSAKSMGRIDLLLAGPPCQGHSNLNNRTRNEDPRNALYLRVVRAAEVLRPSAVIVENVPSVLRDRGRVVQNSISILRALGFTVREGTVKALDLGLAQERRRHFLLAVRRGGSQNVKADAASIFRRALIGTKCTPRPISWAIRDLESVNGVSAFDRAPIASDENTARMKWLMENDAYDLPDRLRPPCQQTDHKYKSIYGRLHWDLPAQTITTGFRSMGQGRYVHPSQPRTLTAHEAARLQGFPDFFDFGESLGPSAWARLIGNAVPPIMIQRFVSELIGPVIDPESRDG